MNANRIKRGTCLKNKTTGLRGKVVRVFESELPSFATRQLVARVRWSDGTVSLLPLVH